jgi:PD-(D/E)XK endonuclease
MGETRALSVESRVDPACKLHRKRRGDVGELAFMRKAISLGYGVAKPWGDSDHYDLIINRGKVFWRIQVKSVWSTKSYWVKTTGSNGKTYTADEIDFLIAYINAEELWYVFPVAALKSRSSIVVWPYSRRSQFEEYREAWKLLIGRSRNLRSAPRGEELANMLPDTGPAALCAE